MAAQARKKENELAKRAKAEANSPDHEGAGAIWGWGAGGAGAGSQAGMGTGSAPTRPSRHAGGITKRGRSSKAGMRASFRVREAAGDAEEEEEAAEGEEKEDEEGEEGEGGEGEEEEEEEESDTDDCDGDEENYRDAVVWVGVGLRVYAHDKELAVEVHAKEEDSDALDQEIRQMMLLVKRRKVMMMGIKGGRWISLGLEKWKYDCALSEHRRSLIGLREEGAFCSTLFGLAAVFTILFSRCITWGIVVVISGLFGIVGRS